MKNTAHTEGFLRKKGSNSRWSIFARNGMELAELASGSLVEVKIGDSWILTNIEHGSRDYYATRPGIRLYDGMPARHYP